MNKRIFTCAFTLVLLLAGFVGAGPAAAATAAPPAANTWQTYVPDPSAPTQNNPTSSTIGSSQQVRNAEYLWYKLRRAGATPAGAAAVLGNVQWESHFDPGAVECGGQCSWSEGLGLIQWSFGRRDALARSATAHHVRWYNLDFQVWYIQYEMRRSYPGVWRLICTAQNPQQAAVLVHRYYEGSNDNPQVVLVHRGGAAKYWYNRLFWYGFFS